MAANASKKFWKTIFEHERILTDSEAEDILELISRMRKEHGFRRSK